MQDCGTAGLQAGLQAGPAGELGLRRGQKPEGGGVSFANPPVRSKKAAATLGSSSSKPPPRSSEGADEVSPSQPEAGSCGRAEGGSLIGMGTGRDVQGQGGQGFQPSQQLLKEGRPWSPTTEQVEVRVYCVVHIVSLSTYYMPAGTQARLRSAVQGKAGGLGRGRGVDRCRGWGCIVRVVTSSCLICV